MCDCPCTCNKLPPQRGKVLTYYNYELYNKETDTTEYYKTRDEIKEKYGICLSSIRTIIKGLNRRDSPTSKYLHFNIKKIKIKITD